MNRRNILKKVGTVSTITLLPVATVGSASARKESVNGVNVNFNPRSKEQIRKFFEDLGNVDEEQERIEVHEHLDSNQAEAIIRVLENLEFRIEIEEVENEEGEEDGVSTQVLGDGEANFSATEYVEHSALGYTVVSLEYEVEWEYNINEVSNVSERVRPRTHDATWSVDGETGSNWLVVDSDEWNGRSQHKFSYVGGGTIPTVEVTPWIELKGYANGAGEVVDSGDGN